MPIQRNTGDKNKELIELGFSGKERNFELFQNRFSEAITKRIFRVFLQLKQ